MKVVIPISSISTMNEYMAVHASVSTVKEEKAALIHLTVIFFEDEKRLQAKKKSHITSAQIDQRELLYL